MPTDVGERLFCIVTGTNAFGVGLAHSNVVGPVVGPAGAFAFVASATASGEGTTPLTTGAIDTTGAKLLVIGLSDYAGALPPPIISDSKGNTWTQLAINAGATARSKLYYSVPSSVGAGHMGIATSAGANFYGVITFAAFSNDATPVFDVQAGGTGTGTTASAGSGITPTAANALVIAHVSSVDAEATAITDGFTIVDAVANVPAGHTAAALAYLIQTTAALADPDWTIGSSEWAASIASFKV